MSCITKILFFVIISLCVSHSFAHTYLSAVFINNEKLNEGDCVRPHPQFDKEYPIPSVTVNDMTCGWLPSAAQPANRKCPLAAGSKIGIQWQHNSNSPYDDIMERTHKGPIMFYMARSESGSGPVWFKIYEDGYNPSTGIWATDKMIDNRGRIDITIPSDIAPGNYLLRGEILALHNAYDVGGIQPYVGCVELQISGSGSATPSGVSFPGAYTPTGPGMLLNVYQYYNSYTIPGPAVYIPGSSPTLAPTNSPSTPAPTTRPTSYPTSYPTYAPTNGPTNGPTNSPTNAATNTPTNGPTNGPTNSPTNAATNAPTNGPTNGPTNSPSSSCGALKVTSSAGGSWQSYGKTVTQFNVEIKNQGSQSLQVKFKLSGGAPIEIWSLPNPDAMAVYSLPSWFGDDGLPAGNSVNFGYSTYGNVPLDVIFTNPSCGQPTNSPSVQPTNGPTNGPTNAPSVQPTNAPSAPATSAPTVQPTNAPVATSAPTGQPTNGPATKESIVMTLHPGSSAWWAGLHVSGGGETIVKVEWKDNKTGASWVSLADHSFAYVFTENVFQDLPISVRVTSSSGKQVSFPNVITSWDPTQIDTGISF